MAKCFRVTVLKLGCLGSPAPSLSTAVNLHKWLNLPVHKSPCMQNGEDDGAHGVEQCVHTCEGLTKCLSQNKHSFIFTAFTH